MTTGLSGLAGAWVGVGEAPSVVEGLGELVATGGSESAVSKAPAANMPRGAMIATAARTATPAVAARRRRIVPAVVLTASRLIGPSVIRSARWWNSVPKDLASERVASSSWLFIVPPPRGDRSGSIGVLGRWPASDRKGVV